nr:hypothetical protein [Tanacetum cinerariifolium]
MLPYFQHNSCLEVSFPFPSTLYQQDPHKRSYTSQLQEDHVVIMDHDVDKEKKKKKMGKRSTCEHVNQAVDYVKHLEENIKGLSTKRDELKKMCNVVSDAKGVLTKNDKSERVMVECSQNDSITVTVSCRNGGTEILVKSNGNKGFQISSVLKALVQEGIDVISCNSTKVNDKFLIYSIHSKVIDEKTSIQESMLQQKLAELVNSKRYFDGHVDIFDMVSIDLCTVVALNMMVVQLSYTGESERLSFKLIEVYMEHGVTAVDSYRRPPPRVRATIEDITDDPGSSSSASIEYRFEKILLLTWHDSSEPTKELVCDSVTPRSLPQHDSSTSCKDSVCEFVTPRCLPHSTASHVIENVMRQLSFEKTELDGDAWFGDVVASGIESSRLSRDESFGVNDLDLDLDLNLNEHVDLNVFQIKTQYELLVSEEPNIGRTQEPIVEEVRTQEPIVKEEDESTPSDGHFFYDVEGIDSAYKTQCDVQSSKDAGTDDDDDDDEDDDDDDDFFADEENKVVEPDVDVNLFGISMDVPFDNISVTNQVPDDVLEGEDVDVINANGFHSDPSNDNNTSNYRRRMLAELSREI